MRFGRTSRAVPSAGGSVNESECAWNARARARALPAVMHRRLAYERDDVGFRDPPEFRGSHVDDLAVRAGVERNLRLGDEAAVEVNAEAVNAAEWRHGAQLAIGEERAELVFGREADLRESQRRP